MQITLNHRTRPRSALCGVALLTSALLLLGCGGAPTTEPSATPPVAATAAAGAAVEAAGSEPPAAPAVEAMPAEESAPVALPTVDPTGDEAAARLVVPEGFAINTYFSGLDVPRLMAIGPDGNLFVAEQGSASVVRLVDTDGNGIADERQVVAEGLNGAHSVEWFGGALYVAEYARIVRLADMNNDGDMWDDGELVTITDNIPSGQGHTSRTLHFGPDGNLYVAAGSSGNNDIESDRRRATIMRFHADGTIPDDNPFAQDPDETRRPVWAEGLRNSVDFVFLPDGRLWATHNGSDMLGDDLPPEEIVINVERGRHYGWPYCYTPDMGVVQEGTLEVHDERVAFDDRVGDCSEVVPALFTDLAHQAPLGVAYYGQGAFPAAYQGSLFVAYHGSWNSGVPRDCKVQQIVVRDGQPVESHPFVTGFRDSADQGCGAAWGRPAGVVVGANGELFISDDQNGNIYRVVSIN